METAGDLEDPEILVRHAANLRAADDLHVNVGTIRHQRTTPKVPENRRTTPVAHWTC